MGKKWKRIDHTEIKVGWTWAEITEPGDTITRLELMEVRG